jgi:hypothetical protein
MQPAFRAPGRPWQIFSGEAAVPRKPSALKPSEQTSGIIGMASFRMLNFSFAKR